MNTDASSSTYATVIYVSSTLSLFTNAALLALYLQCPLKTIKAYKYFFAMMTVHDIVMSTSVILCVPRANHGKLHLVYISTGLLHKWQFGEVVLMLFWFVMASSMIILMNSFVYRYVHICRPELSYLYTSRRWVLLIWALNGIFLLNCVFLLIATSLPNDAFRAQIYADFSNLQMNAFIGVSLVHSIDERTAFLAADIVVAMLFVSCTGSFCAVRIHSTLKQGGISAHVRRLQRQMFRVLIFQTASPAMFLYFPVCVNYLLLFGRIVTVPLVTDCLGFLVSLYSFFNPIVTMLSISDYRRYLLSLLRQNKNKPQGQSAVSSSNPTIIVSERNAR
ncbi:unnamed protein product [Heligmosomoides polygyrus]|uniref:G_PROTEIN_RECEP_F1_2 domain-containing protein n=1 Tax=Heligmosomoides polygyrus TaxID=6339 RepID=A0A183FS16_HELPZ|nr:unnamed protein product [Heligmosomoides polygyrus]